MGTSIEPELSQQSRATFEKHARRTEDGEMYMAEEDFVNAIAPESEDYVSGHCMKEQPSHMLTGPRVAQDQARAVRHPLSCRGPPEEGPSHHVGLEQLREPPRQGRRRVRDRVPALRRGRHGHHQVRQLPEALQQEQGRGQHPLRLELRVGLAVHRRQEAPARHDLPAVRADAARPAGRAHPAGLPPLRQGRRRLHRARGLPAHHPRDGAAQAVGPPARQPAHTVQHLGRLQDLVRQRARLPEHHPRDGPGRPDHPERGAEERRRQDHPHRLPQRGRPPHPLLPLHPHGGRHPLPLRRHGRALRPPRPQRLLQGPRRVVAERVPLRRERRRLRREGRVPHQAAPARRARVRPPFRAGQHRGRVRRLHGVPDRPGQDAHAEPAVRAGRPGPVQELHRVFPESRGERGAPGPLLGRRAAADRRRAGEGDQADRQRSRAGALH